MAEASRTYPLLTLVFESALFQELLDQPSLARHPASDDCLSAAKGLSSTEQDDLTVPHEHHNFIAHRQVQLLAHGSRNDNSASLCHASHNLIHVPSLP